jgi:hypothetical protein
VNFNWTSVCFMGSLLLAASAPALTQSPATGDSTSTSDSSNPYAVIVDRNVFHLNPLPKPKSDADQKPVDIPKVSLNGIIHIGDDVEVLFSIPAKDNKNPATYYKLAPGEKDDVLELLRIRPGEQEVDVLVDGTPVTLSILKDSPESSGSKGGKGPPPAIPMPPPPGAAAGAQSSSAIIVGGDRESRYGGVAVGGGGVTTIGGGDSGSGGVAVGGGTGSTTPTSYGGGGGYGGGSYGGVTVGGGPQAAATLLSGAQSQPTASSPSPTEIVPPGIQTPTMQQSPYTQPHQLPSGYTVPALPIPPSPYGEGPPVPR